MHAETHVIAVHLIAVSLIFTDLLSHLLDLNTHQGYPNKFSAEHIRILITKQTFRNELKEAIKDDMDFDTFNKHFIQVLDKYAPIEQKTVRANNTPYMTKALRKAMMKRTELANKYHKHRKDEDYAKFRKHRNYVNRLYKKERRDYFNNLQKPDLEDINSFLKTVKPLLSDVCMLY